MQSAKPPVPSHTRQMQETAVTDLALSNALQVAKALSLTASDLLRDASLVEAAKAEYGRPQRLRLHRRQATAGSTSSVKRAIW